MLYAYGRLLLISLLVIIGIILAGLSLRHMGTWAEFAPLNHPVVQSKPFWIAHGGLEEDGPIGSMKALKGAVAAHSKVILGLQVHLTMDDEFIVFHNRFLEELTDGVGPVATLKWKDIENVQYKNSDQKILKLDHVLETFSDQRFLLEVQIKNNHLIKELLLFIEEKGFKDKVVLSSAFQKTVREMKKNKPTWVFGMDPISLARYLTFESIFLETVANVTADLVIAPVLLGKKTVWTQRSVKELKRREKLLVFQSIGTQDFEVAPHWIWRHADGVMTSRTKDWEKFLAAQKLTSR